MVSIISQNMLCCRNVNTTALNLLSINTSTYRPAGVMTSMAVEIVGKMFAVIVLLGNSAKHCFPALDCFEIQTLGNSFFKCCLHSNNFNILHKCTQCVCVYINEHQVGLQLSNSIKSDTLIFLNSCEEHVPSKSRYQQQ